jgi:hypothetical protein
MLLIGQIIGQSGPHNLGHNLPGEYKTTVGSTSHADHDQNGCATSYKKIGQFPCLTYFSTYWTQVAAATEQYIVATRTHTEGSVPYISKYDSTQEIHKRGFVPSKAGNDILRI